MFSAGQVTKDECLALNGAISDKYLPTGCLSLLRAQSDPFASPQTSSEKVFVGKDKEVHRNSWLWPKMARRLTRDSPAHVSNWRKPVTVDENKCEIIEKALKEKFGDISKLPKACQSD